MSLAHVANTNIRQYITLYALFDEYLESISEKSRDTISYYLNDFKKVVEDKDILAVTVNDIQKYINYKKSQNLKDSTLFRYYRMLITVFNYALSHEYIEKNLVKNVNVKSQYSETRDIDYSKKYIRSLLKLFKKTNLYYIVLIALHTRNA